MFALLVGALLVCMRDRAQAAADAAPDRALRAGELVEAAGLAHGRCARRLARARGLLQRIHARAEWQTFCAAVVAASPGDAEFVRALPRTASARRIASRASRAASARRRAWSPATTSRCSWARASSSEQFATPLYRRPDDLLVVDLAARHPGAQGQTRARAPRGQQGRALLQPRATREAPGLAGHEIVWIDNALDAFLLEVQGSGRVQLTTGETIRLQYEDQNGHPYRSIGKYLVDQGAMPLEQVNMPAIRAWLAANPQRLREVLDSNPSVVFFREAPLEDPSVGPKGALGVPLTAGRSIAIDPKFLPLGRADVPLDDAARHHRCRCNGSWWRRTPVAPSADPCARTCSSASARKPASRPA